MGKVSVEAAEMIPEKGRNHSGEGPFFGMIPEKGPPSTAGIA